VRAESEAYYLRQLTREDFEKQLSNNVDRGFPSMFSFLDCMHYEWKNCLDAWQSDFGYKDGKKSIILEAIVDGGLHIWHAFFCLPGSNNDVNILGWSPLVHIMFTKRGW
jgi:hypothetical protein